MPVAGRKPTPDRSQVRHRNPAAHDWVEVENTPYDGPRPELPARYKVTEDGERVRVQWPARTRAWWESVSRMPHCRLWTDGDWQFALDTAEVHARFVEGDRAAELRIRERVMGTTSDALRDLRIRYVDPAPAAPVKPTGVVSIDDYRRLYDG